jgi:hypothetical protein
VVYETDLADQVERNLKAVNHVVSKVADLTADEIAENIWRAAAQVVNSRSALSRAISFSGF